MQYCDCAAQRRLTVKVALYLLPGRGLRACAEVLVEEALIAAEARVMAEHCAGRTDGSRPGQPSGLTDSCKLDRHCAYRGSQCWGALGSSG